MTPLTEASLEVLASQRRVIEQVRELAFPDQIGQPIDQDALRRLLALVEEQAVARVTQPTPYPLLEALGRERMEADMARRDLRVLRKAAQEALRVLNTLDAQAADGGGMTRSVHVTVEGWRAGVSPVIAALAALAASARPVDEEGCVD